MVRAPGYPPSMGLVPGTGRAGNGRTDTLWVTRERPRCRPLVVAASQNAYVNAQLGDPTPQQLRVAVATPEPDTEGWRVWAVVC